MYIQPTVITTLCFTILLKNELISLHFLMIKETKTVEDFIELGRTCFLGLL